MIFTASHASESTFTRMWTKSRGQTTHKATTSVKRVREGDPVCSEAFWLPSSPILFKKHKSECAFVNFKKFQKYMHLQFFVQKHAFCVLCKTKKEEWRAKIATIFAQIFYFLFLRKIQKAYPLSKCTHICLSLIHYPKAISFLSIKSTLFSKSIRMMCITHNKFWPIWPFFAINSKNGLVWKTTSDPRVDANLDGAEHVHVGATLNGAKHLATLNVNWSRRWPGVDVSSIDATTFGAEVDLGILGLLMRSLWSYDRCHGQWHRPL